MTVTPAGTAPAHLNPGRGGAASAPIAAAPTTELLVVVDYGSGNLRSVHQAALRVHHEAARPVTVRMSADPDDIRRADRVILPGQGAFGDCRRALEAIPGMIEALDHHVRRDGKPLFGICVGMQLFAERGFEHGEHPGFGWVAGEVAAIPPAPGLKIPHMGWNALALHDAAAAHPVLAGVETGAHAYFAHSYRFKVRDPRHILASAEYGADIAALVGEGVMIGAQFHPEKSQAVGLRLLRNFFDWRP